MRDVLIVGGGLSGAAAAIGLAGQGAAVRLLERQGGPFHKICGEFLSIEAQEHLALLGLDLDALGASRIDRMRLVAGGAVVEARLPFTARGLSRWVLDEALLDRAEAAGVAVERPVRVLALGEDGVRTDRGDYRAGIVMIATGKIGLRDDGAAVRESARDAHVGFKMHWRLAEHGHSVLDDIIELTLFPGGYAGLQLVEGGVANLCLVLRRDRLAMLGGRWEDVLASIGPLSPGLRALADAQALFARPVTIANLPYGHIHGGEAGERAYRIGDQAAMTASLTGDGMAIALRSGWLAAHSVAEGLAPAAFHARLRAMVGVQVKRGMRLQHLSEIPWLSPMAMRVIGLCPAALPAMVRATRLPDLARIERR